MWRHHEVHGHAGAGHPMAGLLRRTLAEASAGQCIHDAGVIGEKVDVEGEIRPGGPL